MDRIVREGYSGGKQPQTSIEFEKWKKGRIIWGREIETEYSTKMVKIYLKILQKHNGK